MSKLEKLDLMGVTSLAVVTAALLAGWIVTTSHLAPASARPAGPDKALTLNDQGSMKLTVTAERELAVASASKSSRVASTRNSAGQALQVALPIAFRP